MILCSPGVAFLPVVGPVLALVVAGAGLLALFSFQVLMWGPCPFCESSQTVLVPAAGLTWRQIRAGSTRRVFGADCTVCANRIIVRVDDRVAIPAPRVVAAAVNRPGTSLLRIQK